MTLKISESVAARYKLQPGYDKTIASNYQHLTDYGKLLKASRAVYQEDKSSEDSSMEKNQFQIFETSLQEDKLQSLYSLKDKFKDTNYTPEDLFELFNHVLTPEVDQEIRDYFGSYYSIIWFSYRTVEYRDNNVSAKWHCDSGPSEHLKTITYFNSGEDHGSATDVVLGDTTDKLKEVGYVFCDINERQENIDDLLEEIGSLDKKESLFLKSGDTILFNPFKVMHKAKLPEVGKERECFDLCFLPSPIPWQETIKRGLKPANKCVAFESFFTPLMNFVSDDVVAELSHDDPILLFDHSSAINGEPMLRHVLAQFFDEPEYVDFMVQQFKQATQGNIHIKNPVQLLEILKHSIFTNFTWKELFRKAERKRFMQILQFEEDLVEALGRYAPDHKPNPDAIYWPVPDHPKNPRSKYDMLPYVQKHPILNGKTPIGSAGSCFAFEIAKVLQEKEYNYVITERADDPSAGVHVDGYEPGDEFAKFSANYGILFNTPSLLQLAEKAFGLRKFDKHLVRLPSGYYTDPYRENVFFSSIEAYEQDYPKHIEAIKQSLLQSEAFIFTAGLNECWQLRDGSVLSRNPKTGFFHMIKHRTLTVEENVEYISKFFTEVKKRNPKFKMILTLSPVPFLATGRADTHHVIEANTHSKAVLRVAIEQVVEKFEDIYYLPSYETVQECVEDAWMPDHRHVRPETIQKVMKLFEEMFFE